MVKTGANNQLRESAQMRQQSGKNRAAKKGNHFTGAGSFWFLQYHPENGDVIWKGTLQGKS